MHFLYTLLTSAGFFVSLEFENYRKLNFPENEDITLFRFIKIEESREMLVIFRNLLQKSSWFLKSFDCLTYFIE